jgi:phenylacetate-CoA ligase
VNPLYEALPVFAQNVACSAAGWMRWEQRFTRHFWRTLEVWDRSVAACEEELRATQALRLADLLDYARRHVPHYAGLPPIVRTRDPQRAIAATLANIPPLEKSSYRDAPLEFLSRAKPRYRWIRGQTSGTTGTALRLWYTRDALAEEYATVWRMRRHHGVAPSDPHLTFGGRMVVPFRASKPPFWRRDWVLNQTLFSLYHMSAENLPAYVEAVHASEATYAQGYPSSLHLIARALLDAGRPLPKGRLKAVFTSSETVLASQRRAIEAAFGAPLYDRYGASEFAVSMTGCEAGNLHVDMEYGIVEVEPQEETAEWVRGPLLVTGFANLATPFIRYRIGDIGTRRKQRCPCGRAGDVFESVDGRIEDYVVTPDGRFVGRLDHVFKNLTDIAEAQILQIALDRILVYVVPQPSFDEASERALLRELRARLGNEIAVQVERVTSIARQPNGKLRAVKSLIAGRRSVA